MPARRGAGRPGPSRTTTCRGTSPAGRSTGSARSRSPSSPGALLLSLEGSVCIYQGEELGQTETELELFELTDPQGIRFWPEPIGRDGCRTPMVWDGGNAESGFSTGGRGCRSRSRRRRGTPRGRRGTRTRCWSSTGRCCTSGARPRSCGPGGSRVLRRGGAGAGLHPRRDGALRLQPVAEAAGGGAHRRRRHGAVAGGRAQGRAAGAAPERVRDHGGEREDEGGRLSPAKPRKKRRRISWEAANAHRIGTPLSSKRCRFSSSGRMPMWAPQGIGGLALLADEDRLLGADVDEEVVVGAEVLGVHHLALPGRVVVVDDDVLGADAEGVAAVAAGDLAVEEVHLRAADEAGDEDRVRALVELGRASPPA